MAKFVKMILFLLFAVALHCVASDFFAEKSVKEECRAAVLSLEHGVSETAVARVQSPQFPVAELAGGGIQTQQVVTSRIQRIHATQYILSLKSLGQKLVDCEAALSQNRQRLYDNTTSYCCHPVNDYYVFALRRIIV